MKRVTMVAAVLCAVFGGFAASETYVKVPTADKAKGEDLLFLVTFDRHNARADFAKGSPDSFSAKDLDLGLRGLIGFDLQSAYKAVPGESICFPAKGNFDPHKGTLILWTAANDYEPMDEKTDGQSRGNVLFAQLVAADGKDRALRYYLYECGHQIYFDWTAEPEPWKWGQYGRVNAVRRGQRKGEWHQVAVTWDDDRIALYYDGEQVGNEKLPTAKVADNAGLMPGEAPESFIGVRNEGHGDRHAWDCGIDDFAIYGRAMTPLEIRNQYLRLLKDPGSRKITVYDVTLNGVVTSATDRLDRLEAAFDFSALPEKDMKRLASGGLTLAYTLTGPSGERQEGTWTFSEKRAARILGGVVASGKWTLSTRIGNDEPVVAEITKPEMPWLGNGFGDEDEVPALWKDFAVDGRTVTFWNRTYAFGEGPLPERIVAFGKPLLAKRPRLVVNGREPTWTAGRTSRTNRAVVFSGTGAVGDVRLSYETTVEYDGFVKFDWTLLGTPQIDSMTLDWRMADENHHYLMRPWLCEETEDKVSYPFPNGGRGQTKMLWFVTEKKGGFAFMARNDANWVHDANAPVYFADRRTGACRVEMVQRPTKMPKDCDYQALFIATPTHPLPERNRVIRFTGPLHQGGVWFSHAGGEGFLNSAFTHAPLTDGSFERHYAKARLNSISVYGGVKSLTDQEPETDYLGKYWERPGASTYTMGVWREPEKGKRFKISTLSRSACAATVYTDYVVWCDWKLWTHPLQDRFWQSYFDLCGVSFCQNALHGCRYQDRFGRWVSTLDVLPGRKMTQRLVALAHKYGKTVILHGQREFFPFVTGLADYWFPGEQYGALMHRNLYGYTDEVSDDILGSELNRDVLGVGVIHLPAIGQALRRYGAEENWKYTWGMLAKLQLHDIETAEVYASGKPVRKVWDILENYGCDDPSTVCHLYSAQSEVTSSDPAVRITWYDCPEKRKLLVLSNCDLQPHATTVDVSALKAPDLAYDEIMDRPVPVKDGKFDITVPARALLMVALPPKDPKEGRRFMEVKPAMGEFLSDRSGESWAFDSWDRKKPTYWKSEGAKIEFGHRTDVGHGTAGALVLRVREGNLAKRTGSFVAHFPAKPGNEYTAEIWVKAEGLADDGNVRMSFQGKDAKKAFLGTAPVSSGVPVASCRAEWKRIRLTFTVPTEGKWAKCAYLQVSFGIGGTVPGAVSFDDFSFR